MNGFVSGLLAGTGVVAFLGVSLSLTTPLAHKPQVSTAAPQVGAAPVLQDTSNMDGAQGNADLVELPPHAPESAEDRPDTLAELDETGLQPDTRTVTTDIPEVQAAPSISTAPQIAPASESPAAVPISAPAPATPRADAVPELVAELPAPSPQPVLAEPEPAVPTEDELETAERAEPEPPKTDEQVAILQPVPQPQIELPRLELPQVGAETAEPETPISTEEESEPRNLPRIAELPQIGSESTGASGITIGKRVVPLTERDDETVETADESDPVVGKPIEAYAAPFENPENKPLMSIILIDDEGAYGVEALQDFPYPISFAVHPSDPQAAEKLARHRAAGFEVLAIVDLPNAASAQDAEVSLAVWLETLPQTVGILEGVTSGIQGNRKQADQVAAIAGDTGRGLVTQGRGLNTVQKLAARNGIPSSVVFRDFDGAQQDPAVMRRFLDQAAFRAGQEGAVVMLGRLRPDTISALLLWGLEDRGNRVAMAPISAVMLHSVQ